MNAGTAGNSDDCCAAWRGDDLLLDVRVQARASRNEIIGAENDRLKLRTTAAPTDGKANAAVVRLLADYFQMPKSRVRLISGARARNKRFRLAGPVVVPMGLRVATRASNSL